jgi:hypothetical protein
MILQLNHLYASEVEDIITSLSEWKPYTRQKTELMMWLSPSREQRIRQLLMLKEIGDRKPFQFLKHFRSLAPDVPDDFLCSIWSSRVPTTYRQFSLASPRAIWTPRLLCRPHLLDRTPASAHEHCPTPRQRCSFTAYWRALLPGGSTESRAGPHLLQLQGSRPSSRNRRPGNRSPSRDDATSTLYWYYRRYGARAQMCTQLCPYHQQGN